MERDFIICNNRHYITVIVRPYICSYIIDRLLYKGIGFSILEQYNTIKIFNYTSIWNKISR